MEAHFVVLQDPLDLVKSMEMPLTLLSIRRFPLAISVTAFAISTTSLRSATSRSAMVPTSGRTVSSVSDRGVGLSKRSLKLFASGAYLPG